MKKMHKRSTAIAISAFMLAQAIPFGAIAADSTNTLTIYPYTVTAEAYNALNDTDNHPSGSATPDAAQAAATGTENDDIKFNVTQVNEDGTPVTGGYASAAAATSFENLPDGLYLIDPVDDSTNANLSDADAFIIQLPVSQSTGVLRDVKIYPKLVDNTDNKVTFTKKDTDNAPLKDAVYDLYYKDAAGTWKKASGTYQTSAAGQIEVTGLPIGDYYFIEQTAPTGYLLDQKPVKFTIDGVEASTATATNDAELTVEKNIIKGSGTAYNWLITADVPSKVDNLLSYTITDDYTDGNITLADTPITSVKCGTTTLAATADYTVDTATTGKIVIELTAGGLAKLTASTPLEITVASTLKSDYSTGDVSNEASIDYQYAYDPSEDEDTDPDLEDIIEDAEIPDPDPADPTDPDNPEPISYPDEGDTPVGDEFTPGQFTISNVDPSDETKELGEASYTIYDEDGNEVVSADDDDNGIAAFENLTPGHYVIKQTAVDSDHIIDDSAHDIYIGKDGKAYSDEECTELIDDDNKIPFKNTKKSGFNLPFTGTTATIFFTLTGIILMAGTGFFIFLLLKKKDDDEEEQENA